MKNQKSNQIELLKEQAPSALKVAEAAVIMGEAVAIIMDRRAPAVLAELRRVCEEMFDEAETIMNDTTETIQ